MQNIDARRIKIGGFYFTGKNPHSLEKYLSK
jgi:hypothetical protein